MPCESDFFLIANFSARWRYQSIWLLNSRLYTSTIKSNQRAFGKGISAPYPLFKRICSVCLSSKIVQTQIALNLLSIASLGFIKLSALFFYKRIFCVSGRNSTLNAIIMASIVMVACWVVTFEFLIGFQCHLHFSALWDGTQRQYCTYAWPALLGQAISDFFLDVWVLMLPIYPVCNTCCPERIRVLRSNR